MARGTPAVHALVDCNNFYASCERLFRPDLKHRPVIVLSNNDGCVVARSAEAKALGIGMAVPFHEVADLVRRHRVAVFSSNYALYADISNRVVQVLEELAPRVEVYSIDEAFLDLSGLTDPEALAREIRERVHRWVGVPVSLGLAPTRTLAKLANAAAKRWPATGGVVDLRDPARARRLMARMPVGEVWGVGRRLSARLQAMGIDTALALAESDPGLIRRRFSVSLERTLRELRGTPCLALEETPPPQRQIICSRSFAERITALEPLREAVRHFAARAAERLREQGRLARQVSVYLRTNPHHPREPQHHPLTTVTLPVPTADSRDLVAAARRGLEAIWRPGHRYMKAGVVLTDLYAPGEWQADLFATASARRRPEALMAAIDRINARGRGRIFFAGEGLRQGWQMRREHLSPCWTTRWEDLPRVR